MSSRKSTIQLIANIISYTSNTDELKTQLNQPRIDWDALVKLGSKHLLLPAIYSRLQAKELLDYIPNDLKSYLKDITTINRNRNKTILKEIKSISEIFNSNDIDHVFLKGSALLVANYFDDISQRMIGDIDILVINDSIDKANQLLLEQGYKSQKEPLSYNYLTQKHLPRLISDNSLAAVELHYKLLKTDKIPGIQPDNMLKQKLKINGITVPAPLHLLKHGIFSHLYDDDGAYYNNLNLKSAFDTITITNKEKVEVTELQQSYYKNYFKLLALVFNDISSQLPNLKQNTATKFYTLRIKNTFIDRIWIIVLFTIKRLKIYFNRFLLFVSNKSYRKLILRCYNPFFKALKINNVI